MTRDHKVALIVGFALVLVVGVLISDHMSAAQEAEMDAAIGSGGNTGDGEVARGDQTQMVLSRGRAAGGGDNQGWQHDAPQRLERRSGHDAGRTLTVMTSW